MMDLTQPQWVRHTLLHPFEGFEDLRWKKGGTLKYTVVILIALFFALIANDRWCGFQFRPLPDALFSVVPYLMRSVVYFLAWVVGNWAVCTLLEGEGTMRNICIYSSYALIPYIVSTFINVILSHILVQEELVFFAAVYYIGLIWSGLLLFSAVKEQDHQHRKERQQNRRNRLCDRILMHRLDRGKQQQSRPDQPDIIDRRKKHQFFLHENMR